MPTDAAIRTAVLDASLRDDVDGTVVSSVALSKLRLDGDVAREACGAALSPFAGFLPHLIPVRGDVAGHAVPRIIAHAIVGACDSWAAELADGRVAVAVRTPNTTDEMVEARCLSDWSESRCMQWHTFARTALQTKRVRCPRCRARGGQWNVVQHFKRQRPGRWYRAAFPTDPKPSEWPAKWRTA